MIDMLSALMARAIEQLGRDRFYTVVFSASTPIVRVYEDPDGDRLADFWMSNGVIQEKKFF